MNELPPEIEELEKKLEKNSVAILNSFLILLWVTFSLMVIILICGILKIVIGIYIEIWLGNDMGLVNILHGIELIFVSPLPHLFLGSFAKYISATRLEINPDLTDKKSYMKHSVLEITNAKLFTIGLFISLLFLHSIDLILQKKAGNDLLFYILPLLLTLIGFYFILDKLSEKIRD